MNLYVLTEKMKALDARLDDVDGVADGDILADLAKMEGAVEDSVDEVGQLIREYESRAVFRQTEADRLAGIADKDTLRADRLKAALRSFMQERDLRKVATPHFDVIVKKNGGKAPMEITGEVPADFKKQPPAVPDNEKIRAAIEAGMPITFAILKDRGSHLEIR